LTLTGLNVDLVRLAIEYDAPLIPTICPMAGSTSPYTMASTLVQCHAESLFLAALSQAFKPGHPFIYSAGPSVMDMRSGHDLYYTIDKALWGPATVQLGKACKVPTGIHHCGSMTHRYDPQNGVEGMLLMLGAVASGADLLCSFGSTYTAMGMSAEMMIMQEAWMKAAQYMVEGIRTDDTHLGLDRLKRAGPGGNFLTDELTLRYMHGGEFFDNDIFDNAACGEAGRSMLERAHDRVEELVDGYESPVPEGVREGLQRYFHDECKKLEA
ncbi:MAG: trimethylamine methyltransferase family protein, partial [Planctomycetota bacterium]|nr:trimethylamine methyltransferase family protein [Planctomycetota bacterium]